MHDCTYVSANTRVVVGMCSFNWIDIMYPMKEANLVMLQKFLSSQGNTMELGILGTHEYRHWIELRIDTDNGFVFPYILTEIIILPVRPVFWLMNLVASCRLNATKYSTLTVSDVLQTSESVYSILYSQTFRTARRASLRMSTV